MADRDDGDASESTPLMLASPSSSTGMANTSQPPSPGSGARPKPPRSVTFNANPVSETYEADPHHYAHPRTGTLAGRQPHPINTSMHGHASGFGGPFSAGAPVLSSFNSKVRRRNSHGSGTPLPGGMGGGGHGGGVGLSPHAFHAGMSYPGGGFMPKVGPQRSTKNAQKLKLLPNTDPTGDDDATELEGDGDGAARDVYSQYARIKDPSARRDAARLGKADRERLPRVTAYCTANKYQMEGLMRFLKGRGKTRGANPKLIDECIYTPYNYNFGLDVVAGARGENGRHENGWSGRRSSRGYDAGAEESHQEARAREQQSLQEPASSLEHTSREEAEYPNGGASCAPNQDGDGDHEHPRMPSDDSGYGEGFPSQRSDGHDDHHEQHHHQSANYDYHDQDHNRPITPEDAAKYHAISESPISTYGNMDSAITDSPISPMHMHHQENHDPHVPALSPLDGPESHPTSLSLAAVANNTTNIDQILDTHVHTPEVFLFDYGVVVIWGMSEAQEEKFLKELEKFEIEKLAIDEVQTELFNYYYTREYQPRIYNDFITLRDKTNYRTKLAISHGLAQSVKTSLFEELVATTIEQTKDIPSEIALTGTIALNRSEINMQIGELFILRINIHQSGSVLDTPELFWVEPQLEPVYQAVRSYLEMDRRVKVLTSRLEVIGDLLAVLKDQLSHGHGEKLEWIVIVLIAVEILVAAINIYVDIAIVD